MSWDRNIIIKSEQEIAIMREAGRITARVLSLMGEMVRPGITTGELDAAAEETIRKHGALPSFKGYPGPYPYPASICTSINDELVHGIPGKRKLKEGDIISIDCGSTFEGYVGDAAITLGVGEISPAAQRLLEVTQEALWVGIQKMLPGNHVGDVSTAIQQYVEGEGYSVTREYTGHGVGRNMHEGPQVPNYGTQGRGPVLRSGMTIALEPMVLAGTPRTQVLEDKWVVASADGALTAHFEHTVAVMDGNPMILTLP
jgi:methionyl aminopeptidase